MLNFSHPNIDESIVQILSLGSSKTTKLLGSIRKKGIGITKQGFYKALRKLKKEQVVIAYGDNISLHTAWINNFLNLSKKVLESYITDTKTFSFLDLNEKESLSYNFSSVRNLDNFWGQAQSILVHNTGDMHPIYSYDPHYWFYIARPELEKLYLQEMQNKKRKFLMTVGGKSPLDYEIKKDFNNKFLQYNLGKKILEDGTYLTIIDDFIITITMDAKIETEIEKIFNETKKVDEETKIKLEKILNMKSKNRMKIGKNKQKAEFLKNKFKKDFY